MKTNYFILFAFVLCFSTSCEKETNEIEKIATITINSPTSSTVINQGDTLNINAIIQANFELHGYTLLIYPFNNQATKVFERHNHTHGETININEEWVNTSISGQELILEVVAHLSHNAEEDQRQTVQFVVN